MATNNQKKKLEEKNFLLFDESKTEELKQTKPGERTPLLVEN